jgi:hypothetical protein
LSLMADASFVADGFVFVFILCADSDANGIND